MDECSLLAGLSAFLHQGRCLVELGGDPGFQLGRHAHVAAGEVGPHEEMGVLLRAGSPPQQPVGVFLDYLEPRGTPTR